MIWEAAKDAWYGTATRVTLAGGSTEAITEYVLWPRACFLFSREEEPYDKVDYLIILRSALVLDKQRLCDKAYLRLG